MDDRTETRASYPGWPVACTAAVGVFFASLVVVTFPVFLKPWSEAFGWSRRDVSLAFGIAAISAGLCAVPLGLLLDRVNVRRVALPSLAALGVLFASLSALTPSLAHLHFLFAALGIAAVGTSPVAYARAVSGWFRARRGLALAIVITGGALGGIVFPIVATLLLRLVGWRATCGILGLAVIALGVPLAWRLLRESPPGEARDAAAEGASVAQGVRSWTFWILALVLFCGTMTQNSVIVHLSALLTDRGVPVERAALALSAMAVSAVVGRLATGWWLDRVFAPRLLLGLLLLASAGAYLLSATSSFGVAVLGAILVGFGTGGEADVIPYLLSRYHGLRSFASLFGLAWLANAIGGALGPVLMGRTFDATGSYESFLIRLALVVLGAAAWTLALPRYGIVGVSGERTASIASGS